FSLDFPVNITTSCSHSGGEHNLSKIKRAPAAAQTVRENGRLCVLGGLDCPRISRRESHGYAGVNVIRLVVRSTEAIVSRQTHWRRSPAGSGWAAHDVSACW